MTIFNDEIFIRSYCNCNILGQYLFSKSESLYDYTSAIYFEQEKNFDI